MFVVAGDVGVLIELASFLVWIAYGGAMSCVIVMRKTHPHIPRPFRVPIVIPIFTVSVSLFLAIIPMITKPSIRYLFALGFILVGVLVYIPFVYMKKRPRLMSKLILKCLKLK